MDASTMQLRENFRHLSIFYIEEKLIKLEVLHFLQNHPIKDEETINREKNQLQILNKKIERYQTLSRFATVARYARSYNPVLLLPHDIICPPQITPRITMKELLFIRKLKQYCYIHNQIYCACLPITFIR